MEVGKRAVSPLVLICISTCLIFDMFRPLERFGERERERGNRGKRDALLHQKTGSAMNMWTW